jgi:hypothetical protein
MRTPWAVALPQPEPSTHHHLAGLCRAFMRMSMIASVTDAEKVVGDAAEVAIDIHYVPE